jgi:D-sedoheptulose 7-phosphate isomerase
MKDFYLLKSTQQISDSILVKQAILNDHRILECIASAINLCISAYRAGHKLVIAGNGGSASDAQHIAAELVGRFEVDRPALPALALTTDTSIITGVGNDYGYEAIFQRQLQANAVQGDVFLGISTSGNSKNILNALRYAKDNNIFTIGLSGQSGGEMKDYCDVCICIPSENTARIQESHILVGHIICSAVENAMFSNS